MKTLDIISQPESPLTKKSTKLDSFVGNTPLYPIQNLDIKEDVKVFAKLEWQQFGGSVKTRAAYRIIQDAIERGELTEGKHLLDASSGNTGIAYAHIGAALGIPVTLCLPENASEERKQILRSLDVNLKLTSRAGGTDEAQEVAKEIYEQNPSQYYYADQYSNPSNWKAHYDTTGPEILDQTNYDVTHFIAGLGTTGTFTGTGRFLKTYKQEIELIALQPDIAMHGLEGWKHLETAHTPAIFDDSVADVMQTVSTEEAHETMKLAAQKEGLLISPSSAANLAGALRLARQLEEGTIVTLFPDDSSKYGEVTNQLFK
ncbi:PLP-dependent cysteine synthase family protein [Fodinibius salsisoli]|uniref:Cysteine synthase family protein n=1 Tax=Fodinibius salsisoli TaxID=2820877 RepID=A0ABT3PQ87_9BACT|nr:cysteine synthase family protein [Fodinibius salsisoli]MCW9708011.1 cysteine synthase family protein [Fodinibius salsisoli]